MSLGSQVVAIDGLRGSDQASNRVLWVADLGESVGGFPGGQSIYSRPIPLAWGGTRHVAEDALGRRYGALGPLSDEAVYFQRLRDLHCVDPLTGKPVWIRKNVGMGNQLFGDDELLFVAPTGEGDTLVLRSATGELLDKRRIVPFEKRMATIGRRVLSWEPQGTQVALQMRDAWQDQLLWSHTFAPGAKAALAGQDAVAVLQPDGQFSLVTLVDGKELVKERLEPENTLTAIQLLRSAGQYLLVTNSAVRNEPNVSVQPLPNAGNSPFINGRVYAFAADSGRKLWPAPAVISQYSMLPAQPSHLPVLVFVRQVSRPAQPPRADNRTSVLCIDKRSGRVAYENDQLPPPTITPAELVGDPIDHTVTLTMGQKLIELKFTDEAPAEAGATNSRRVPSRLCAVAGAPASTGNIEFQPSFRLAQ
jgi:hypothetical protein